MKRNVELQIASVLSLVLLTLHLADDTSRGMFPPTGPGLVYASLATGLLLYGTLMLTGRRSELLVSLVISLFAMAMPYIHTSGSGVGAISKSSGGVFFVETLIALGALGMFSFILSLRGLWKLRSGPPDA